MKKTRTQIAKESVKLSGTQIRTITITAGSLGLLNLGFGILPEHLGAVYLRALAQAICFLIIFAVPLNKLFRDLASQENAALISLLHLLLSVKVATVAAAPVIQVTTHAMANKCFANTIILTILYTLFLQLFFRNKK